MSYASTDDLTTRLGTQRAAELSTDSQSSTTPDTDVLQEHINGAEATINAYLADRYKTPISVASQSDLAALFKAVALDLATYSMYARGGDIPDSVKGPYDERMRFLRDIQAGKASLPASTATIDDPAYLPDAVVSDGEDRLFTRTTLEGL